MKIGQKGKFLTSDKPKNHTTGLTGQILRERRDRARGEEKIATVALSVFLAKLEMLQFLKEKKNWLTEKFYFDSSIFKNPVGNN